MSDDPSVDPSDVADLLARVALRDRGAFRQLYNRTSPRVFGVVMTMLGDRAQAEDLLQEVYLKVWYAAEQFDPARGSADAWLVSMARNRAIDLIRRRRDVPSVSGDDVTDLAELEDDNPRLRECLDALEAEQRQSIFAAFFQGLTHREIAQRFSEPIGTIKSRVRRGLMALKGCLES